MEGAYRGEEVATGVRHQHLAVGSVVSGLKGASMADLGLKGKISTTNTCLGKANLSVDPLEPSEGSGSFLHCRWSAANGVSQGALH